jgi:CRISPR-associated endonuclease/helicase Cas3
LSFWAHSGTPGDTRNWQELPEHLYAVAELASEAARPLGLERAAFCAGLLHDLGKYNATFQRRIMGADVRIDHSTAGGAILRREAAPRDEGAAEILAYCILGHHVGLPDRLNPTEACLDRRIEGFADGLDPVWHEAVSVDLAGVNAELLGHVTRESAGFDLSVAVRMVFSCLVDADFRDTESFYAGLDNLVVDRSWPALDGCLPGMIEAFDRYMDCRPQVGDLNSL